MINDLDIVQWAYLLDPAFQLVNSAGKPLTDGWIEVYIHGTRNKYYCASDFDGTLHPFKIPLDSLGSNIVLASPAYAYDIYVYNKFGSLVMSRYNVSPGNTGGNSGGGVQPTDDDAEHWLGQYGATQPLYGQNAGQTLALPSNPDYHGNFVDHIEYGTINPEGGTAQYPKYMYLNPGLYLVNCVIRFQQKAGTEVNRLDELLVYTGNGNANEDVAWQLDETGPLTDGDCRHCLKMTFIRKVLDTGETSPVDCSNVLYFAPSPKVDWKDAYIQTLQIVKLGAGFGSSSGVEYKAGPGISIDIYNNISVTGMQPASSMGDYVTYEVYNEFVNNVTGDLEDLQREIDYVSSAVSGGGQVYTAGQYVSIQGNEISVTGLQPEGDYASQSDLENLENVVNNVTGDVEEITNIFNNVTGDITNLTEVVNGVTGDIEQLNEDIQTVSAAIPESEEVEFEELDLSQFAQASAVTGLEAQIQEVSSAIPDVTEITNVINNVTGDVQNLTTIVENVTGDINNLETIVNNVTGDINVLETNISNVTGDVTNLTEIVEGVTGDITNLSEVVNNVTGDVTNLTEIVNGVTGDIEQLESDIQAVSAAIPPAQVQSDWAQDDDSQVDFIKNKPDLSVYATKSEVESVTSIIENEIDTVSAAVDEVSGKIPESEEVEFEELDLSQFASASTVTGLETIVNGVTGDIEQIESDIQYVSSVVSGQTFEQVNSDWAATGGVEEILNKPVEIPMLAGANITFTETENGLVISATNGVTGNYATEEELQTAIQTVTGMIPDVSDFVTHDELAAVTGDYATNSDLQFVSGGVDYVSAAVDSVSAQIPESEEVEFEEIDVSNFATNSQVTALEAEIQAVSAGIPAAQVQSDWTQSATGEPDYIKNKPEELTLIAGSNVTLTETASGLVISSEGGSVTGDYVTHAELSAVTGDVAQIASDLQTVSAAIPDISELATKVELDDAIDAATGMIPDVSNLATKTELETVSGHIVNADWNATSGDAEILNKPEIVEMSVANLLAGENVSITASGDNYIISATSGGTVTGDYATHAELAQVTADVQTVSAAIPDVSNFATKTEVGNVEADVQTVSAAIPDVSNFATDADVSGAVSGLQNKLTGITDVVVTNSLPASPVATVLYLIPEA